ncbi:glycosyltransferase family 39 protein [Candidatus Woesearchaeota archaeon]|nr:glycosyltransferase family 39 protein [Candidatus Woesearchaeota archaeon]
MKWIKKLMIWYLVFVLAKFVLSYTIPYPTAFSDSYIYAKMARSIFYDLNLQVGGKAAFFPPLYSLALAPAYLFKSMNIIYPVMKLINALISSLILFPSWLITKEFTSKKKAVYAAVLVSILPSNFSFSGYIMAENIFYPLFLFSVYFIYKSFTDERKIYPIISGIFIGLTFLTKTSAFMLFIVVGLLFFFASKKKALSILAVGLGVILPWTLRNMFLLGFNLNVFFRTYDNIIEANNLFSSTGILSFLIWIILYLGFLVLASGILFSLASISFIKVKTDNKKQKVLSLIFLFSVATTLFVLAKYNVTTIFYKTSFGWLTGRPIGRYLDVLLPLILITGFLGLSNKKLYNLPIFFSSIILAASSQLIFFPLFPVNNMSLTWLGIITYESKSIILFSILFFILPFIVNFFYKRIKLNSLLKVFILFFLLVGMTNYTVDYVNSKTYWYNEDHIILGAWLSKNFPANTNIIFDERDCIDPITKFNQALCSPQFIPMAFWMNQNIAIGNVLNPPENIDLIVSNHELDYELIQSRNKINIYKIQK